MEPSQNEPSTSAEGYGSQEVFCDSLDGISRGIPDSFDLGTVPVELTCIASSSKYIVIGAGCGALFIYNKKLGRLLRPLRTNSFEAVTCIRLIDDFIAIGHNTGTLIVIRLPNDREGTTTIAQCIDTDSHRGSPVTCVEWSPDGAKVISGDASGTVIISTVMFDSGDFHHSFLFDGPNSVVALGFKGDSVVIHNGLQLAVIDSRIPSNFDVISDNGTVKMILSLKCTDDFVYIVEKSRICKYTANFSNYEVIQAKQLGDDVGPFHLAEWNESGTKLVVLLSSNTFLIYDIKSLEVLWKSSVDIDCFVGGFCVDSDDSVFYITKPHDIYRIGITPVSKSLTESEPEPPIASLLSSPRKLLSNGASHITQKGFAFFNTAVNTAKDIGANSEVPNILEDAWSKINIKEDLGNLLQNVVDIVDPVNDENIFGRRDEIRPGTVPGPPDRAYEAEEEPAIITVVRKEKGARRKKLSHSDSYDVIEKQQDDSISIDESTLLALRRHVLGDAFSSESPSMAGVSFNSTPTWSSRNSPNGADAQTDEQNSSNIGSLPKDNPPTTSETLSPVHEGARDRVDDGGQVQADEVPIEDHELSKEIVESPGESVQVAESVTVAYEYLLQQNGPQKSDLKSEALAKVSKEINEMKNKVNGERSRRNLVLNDRVDIWTKLSLPYTAKSFVVGKQHLLICHRKKAPRFITLDDVSARSAGWHVVKWSADNVSFNDDESIMWMVRRNVGFCATEPLSATTQFEECAVDGGGVLEVSVGNSVAWYITRAGVSLQMELPEKAIFSKVDRDWPLISISVSENAVWAIRSDTGGLVVRVGLARCKMGLDWVEIIPEGPSKLVSVCVFDTYGFVLDNNCQLWMTAGVDHHHPYGSSDAFFKICLPNIDGKTAPIDAWSVRVSSAGLFLCVGKMMYISRSAVSGHKFPREVPAKFEILDNFSLISAGSFDGEEGSVHVCRQNSEIFVYRPAKRNFVTMNMPSISCAIVSLCSSIGKLSLIDSTGRVFHSTGNSLEWEADTSLSGATCSLVHSELASWAITCDGHILVKPNNTDSWMTIAAPPSLPADATPSQIFSSPNGIYVWILVKGRGWARANINDRNPSGMKWTETYHTSDLCSLAVGDNVVWALDSSARLLRLRGLAAGNPAGNYWRPISGEMFRAISTDARSELWAIDMENHLVRHLSEVFVPNQFHKCDVRDSYEFV
ncbi:hypothetical protein V3C99_014240 [Haemonchus contortus]